MRYSLSARLVTAALAATLSLACATEDRFRAHVESWRGRDAKDLVAELGEPQSKQPAGGSDVMYVYLSQTTVPAFAAGGVGAVGPGSTHYCQVSFLVSGKTKKVVRGEYQGNACRSVF